MKARILSFRRGKNTQTTNQFLVEVDGVNSKKDALKLLGKTVYWVSPAGKKIFGSLTHAHGGKGMLRARFNKGLPGAAIGKPVQIRQTSKA